MSATRTYAWLEPGARPLTAILAGFAEASPQLLDRRELLRRTDTKFVVAASRAAALVAELVDDYAVIRVPSGCVATYRSLYFDTPELQCFHDHRRGRRVRHKIRIREYPDRELAYLEVKTRQSASLTDKQRLAVSWGAASLGECERAFVREHAGDVAGALRPTARIEFRRIGLVSLHAAERVTIDLDLAVIDAAGVRHPLGDLAVIEVKQAPFCVRTAAMRTLARAGLRAAGTSKYVTAIAITHPAEPNHRLRPALRLIHAAGAAESATCDGDDGGDGECRSQR
ncbi:MAG: polyphosphate polymerase domain-containing protein [Myxococcota bacterium]|nr:polyphosphate polymerase domain-containing protein [Myxococcota bacterium]